MRTRSFVKKIGTWAASLGATVAISSALAPSVYSLPTTDISTKPTTTLQTQPDLNVGQIQTPYVGMDLLPLWGIIPLAIFGSLFGAGLVVISEKEVGVVVKKVSFAGHKLPPGRLIALKGEAGYQADTLSPGWHWGYWPRCNAR